MRYSIVLMALTLLALPAYAQREGELVISPGIKIGSSSGDEGGFTVGFEVSLTQGISNGEIYHYVGIVFDYDYAVGGRHKIHIGAETGIPFAGMEIGPTLVFGKGESEPRLALTVTPYVGLLLFPFCSVTFLDPVIFEGGAYLKVPILPYRNSARFN